MKLNVVEKIRTARREVREIDQTTKKIAKEIANHVTKFEKMLAFERLADSTCKCNTLKVE